MSSPRISGSVTDFIIERNRRSEGRKSGDVTPAPKQQDAADTLSLSADAALLQNAEAIAAATPDIDMDKVESVRQAIARGELKIDYEKLAQKMLDFEASLEQ